jgi:subtilisin family serine protease
VGPRCAYAVAIGLCGWISGGYANAPARIQLPHNARTSTFNKSDRSVLAEVLADGKPRVVLNVASRPGQNAAVAEDLSRLGATIRFQDDTVDYLSAVVPIERADEASRLSGIDVVSVDMGSLRPLDTTEPEPNGQEDGHIHRPRFPAPGPTTPRENPFLPTRDIGAPQFVAAHPTFDGRGVTIGIVDTGVELMVPELQTATTLDGRPTHKLVDWMNVTEPGDRFLPLTYPGNALASMGYPYIDSSWVDMRHEVAATDGEIVHDGVTYRVPHPGRYRIGLFDERQPGTFVAANFPGDYYLHGDVNRDGNPPGSSALFAVLWSETTNEVWVDVNQNRSFADDRAMKDYAVRFDVGTFGEDDPTTPVRESVPFVIQTDRRTKFVALGLTNGPHGTMVAGTAAGRGFFGGAFDGVAPGSQIASMMLDGNVYEHSIIEALIKTCRHPAVDVASMDVGSEAWLDGERVVWDVIVNRLVDQYRKPIVVAAMNSGPGMGTIGHPSVATKAISVGAYTGKDTWLANLGVHVAGRDFVTTFSGRGPRGDGQLKPDVVAPTHSLSLMSATFDGANRWNTYSLPPGYQIGGGTSQAAPFVAGAIALLLSAARQEHLPADPERLKLALTNGARFLADYGAHEQGSGLVQVGAAWEVLLKLRELPPHISVVAPVKTTESSRLDTPDRGPGLYEREGWSAGQRGTRSVTATRTSGSATALEYELRWVGNDGTFATTRAVTLPLNTPVDIPITITPATAGVHSAMLQVVDRRLALTIHQIAVTIVAAEDFIESQGFTISHRGQAPRPGSTSHFFRVPVETPLLNLAVTIGSGTLKVRAHDATGHNVDSWMSNNSAGYQPAGAVWSRAFERPHPGVWELIIENAQDGYQVDRSFPDPVPPADYTITAKLLGAAVSRVAQPSTSANGAAPVPILAANRFGAFRGGLKGSVLGTARSERTTLTVEAPRRIFEIDVPPGTERLLAEIDHTWDAGTDVDLYLFDCTGKRCALRAHGADEGSHAQVNAYTPAAGKWTLVIDAFNLPSGTARIEYRDVLLHPLYGRLEVADTRDERAPDDTWRAPVTARVQAQPQTNRTFVGLVDLIADDVNDIERTPKGMAKWPATLGRVVLDLSRLLR